MSRIPVCLSIAGSDSGGGAGIQADLKAFAAAGVHGATALTALTAQNTQAVTGVHPVPPEFIVEQVRAVAQDLGVDAVKIGMVGSRRATEAVARALDELPAGTPVVLDPVMVAESGARLLEEDAEEALRSLLLPRASVVTPNLLEARVLVRDATLDGEQLARALQALGSDAVVVTGGHRDEAADLFFDGTTFVAIPGPRHADGAAHGSGCTHSSTLTAQLALGASPLDAARIARDVAAEAVRNGLRDVGAGTGPVDVLNLAARAGALP
jgi:hydroxymethylpyrimidine/phosphomethylpyrimidine kinase